MLVILPSNIPALIVFQVFSTSLLLFLSGLCLSSSQLQVVPSCGTAGSAHSTWQQNTTDTPRQLCCWRQVQMLMTLWRTVTPSSTPINGPRRSTLPSPTGAPKQLRCYWTLVPVLAWIPSAHFSWLHVRAVWGVCPYCWSEELTWTPKYHLFPPHFQLLLLFAWMTCLFWSACWTTAVMHILVLPAHMARLVIHFQT